jgi:hypothetical protein
MGKANFLIKNASFLQSTAGEDKKWSEYAATMNVKYITVYLAVSLSQVNIFIAKTANKILHGYMQIVPSGFYLQRQKCRRTGFVHSVFRGIRSRNSYLI